MKKYMNYKQKYWNLNINQISIKIYIKYKIINN